MKITSNNLIINNQIYNVIRNTYQIFEKPLLGNSESKIIAKKDTILKRIKEDNLKELNTGFENFEIYYDKSNLINISIGLQS